MVTALSVSHHQSVIKAFPDFPSRPLPADGSLSPHLLLLLRDQPEGDQQSRDGNVSKQISVCERKQKHKLIWFSADIECFLASDVATRWQRRILVFFL